MSLQTYVDQIIQLLQDKGKNAMEAFRLLYQMEEYLAGNPQDGSFDEFMSKFPEALRIQPWYRAMTRLLEFFFPEEFELFGYHRLMELLTLDDPIAIVFCQKQLRLLQVSGRKIDDQAFEVLLDSARQLLRAGSKAAGVDEVLEPEMLIPVTLAAMNRGRGRPSLKELDGMRDENLKLLALVECYGRSNIQLRENLLRIKQVMMEMH